MEIVNCDHYFVTKHHQQVIWGGETCICSRQLPQTVHISNHVIGGRAGVSKTFYGNYRRLNYICGVAGSINHLTSNMDDSNGYLSILEESYAITANLISMVHGSGMSAERPSVMRADSFEYIVFV